MDNKRFVNISTIEASVLDKLTKNIRVSRKEIIDDLKLAETTVDIIINKLISTNVIKIVEDQVYEYMQPLKEDIVILEGQLLLPVSVIDEGETKVISRGSKWYRFPKDFDIRRILWNVDMVENAGNEKNSSLVDLLKATIVKEKRSTTVQLPEYEHLVNKVVPYNNDIGLHMTRIGEDVTDINIIFKVKLIGDDSIETISKGFGARSQISTIELITELNKNASDRCYQNIKIDRQIDINDMIYTGNEFPICFVKDMKAKEIDSVPKIFGKIIKYAKITKMKKTFDFDIMVKNYFGETKVIGSYSYESVSEGIEQLIGMSKPFVDLLLKKNDFVIELC